MTQLYYDKSFDGFLSAIFYVFEHKLSPVTILKNGIESPDLFGDSVTIETNIVHAKRVADGLKQYIGKKFNKQFFRVFHNDRDAVEDTLLAYCRYVFKAKNDVSGDFSHPAVLKVTQIDRSMNREKHRMEAFVRFRLTKDNIYFASIAPDFDVIPFIIDHFENRYGDQDWIIYDLQRKYGIYYNQVETRRVEMEFKSTTILDTNPLYFAEEELAFQELWKNYFKSTNIESRKNMKLHLQHVPKRYWKYLSEKR